MDIYSFIGVVGHIICRRKLSIRQDKLYNMCVVLTYISNLFNNETICCLSVFWQKFTMAGSSQFVPSLNAITTNENLQWLVQPSLLSPPGPSSSPVPPYPSLCGVRFLGPTPSQSHLPRPGVIRAAANTTTSTRRRNDEHVRCCFIF